MFFKKIHLQAIFCLLIFSVTFFCHFQPIKAQKDFEVSLESTYSVTSKGNTYTELYFKIKNKTPTLYISKYALKLGSDKINNIRVTNNGQTLTPHVMVSEGQTSIAVEFPDEILGEGKTRIFSISYQDPDLARVKGKVLEVTIPQLANPEEYDFHGVTLFTPKDFGLPSKTNHENYESTASGNQTKTIFKNSYGQGISAIFGTFQVYDLDLAYHLKNPTEQLAYTEIALPPETAYQQINYQVLEPKPEQINKDQDGNWLATYLLKAGETLDIKAQAKAKVNVAANPNFPLQKPNKDQVKELKYWDISHPKIKEIAASLNSSEDIYNYIVENLDYTTGDVLLNRDRKLASQIPDTANDSTCQEFSDLFVALARAKQIPSKLVSGFAYTEDESLRPIGAELDILHAWPEFFDSNTNTWIPVDPTWGNTTQGVDYFHQFDLNHVVFVMKGKSSELPAAPGSYKPEGQNGKDVQVEFSEDDFPIITPNFEINLKQKKLSFLPLPGYFELEIINKTGSAFYLLNLDYTVDNSQIHLEKNHDQISEILPFQSLNLPIKFYNISKILASEGNLQIKISLTGYEDINTSFHIKSYHQAISYLYKREILLAVGICLAISPLITGSLLVFRRKR